VQASLALVRGVLFVGTHAKTARVRSFDLGGRALGPGFTFRDARAGRSAAAGLAVDDDHTLLVADTPADRVRRFSLFGRELGGLGAPADSEALLPGLVTRPVDVEVRGHRDEGWIAIASGGERRHALQLFEPDLSFRASLRSHGDPARAFRGLCRLAAEGELLYAAEATGRCVQVFRAAEFLFAFQLRVRGGEPFEPCALAPAGGGRLVVGCRTPESALFLVDGSGRPLRKLAGEGEGEGELSDPSDAVLEPGADDRHASIYVVDRDGLRVQVFTLEGRCLGAISLGEPDTARARISPRKKGGR
jgi:hypothetical protein